MKVDEPFNPSIKSKKAPIGLIFRLACSGDRAAIANLMAERNPNIDYVKLLENTDREIALLDSDDKYNLCVAELKNEVIGFCRFFHSDRVPAHKKLYPSPTGWYGSGIMVAQSFRRQRIGQFLSSSRVQMLKEMGVREVYSIVDTSNLTSMKMHQHFGYVEVKRGPGFLQFSFEGSEGCLFKLTI